MTIGPAAENLVSFATVLAEGGASGSGGLGAVMGSKNLKAIVVAGDKRPQAAHPEKVRQLVKLIQANRDKNIPGMSYIPGLTHPHACYGCGINCYRQVYPGEKGRQYKSHCQAGDVYAAQAIRYSGTNDGARLLGTRLCDGYGLDTVVMQSMIEFIDTCYKEGILDEKQTGLPLFRIGSPEFIEELTEKIALRKGFGDILSRGIITAAGIIETKSDKNAAAVYSHERGREKGL